MRPEKLREGAPVAGRYALREKIQLGGVAAIFRADDLHTGGNVAVKFLHPVQSDWDEATKRFEREVRVGGAINHHNVCRILDAGRHEDGRPFLVMELMEGES